MLHQLPADSVISDPGLISTPTPPVSTSFFLSNSPPEPYVLKSTNKAFLNVLTTSNFDPEYKTHMRRLSGISERVQTEVMICQKELKDVKEIQAKRKDRASGKRIILCRCLNRRSL